MKKCDGCGTTVVHADNCPVLNLMEQPLPCTRTKSHPPHKYLFNRTARRCPGIGDLRSVGDLYFCPTVGEIESTGHGGFKVCCAHPELHVYLGYSTPGIEAISQYLSDQAREEYSGPLIHPGQQDPTTIKMPSDADEARQELLRLQVLARAYRDQHLFGGDHIWAQTIHTEDDGLLHLPVYAADGSEAEGLVCGREDAVTLQAMLTDYLAECPSGCDDDCDVACHETHAIPRKRHHEVGVHASEGTSLDHVATALARHDLMNSVGLEPHQELPDKDHPFWTMWRGNARTAITAYNGYIEHTGHRYLSTSCRHGEHGYCQSNTGSQGDKIPAQCKFCGSACVCSCHMSGTVTVVERIVNKTVWERLDEYHKAAAQEPTLEELCTGTDDAMCGVEPPLRADHPDTQWGDCWCTLLPDHEGDHRCEPCTHRHGAPSWPQIEETEADIDQAMAEGTPVKLAYTYAPRIIQELRTSLKNNNKRRDRAIAECTHSAGSHDRESGCIECSCPLRRGHDE